MKTRGQGLPWSLIVSVWCTEPKTSDMMFMHDSQEMKVIEPRLVIKFEY